MLLLLALSLAAFSACAQVTIDGHITPGEWAGARHITDFRDVQPLSGKPGSLPTEAWVMSTPKGLAVAFRLAQPAGVTRTHQRTRRDEEALVDRVNVMVDFDGDGRTGYDFTVALSGSVIDEVITNESSFNKDWDGDWKHAVSEDAQGWSVEILIPWYIAPMRRAHGGKRTIGLYLDRVVGSTGERMAWPTASFMRARFLSDFRKVTLPSYTQSLLAVTPYVSAVHDQVHGGSSFKTGADLFWKPNGQTQLTATVNPDFGQVESDDLVVNFGAEETFFSDKRPFFTENQGIFDFGLLIDNSQLIYTRRVGGPADDGSGPADITGALKLNGSIGDTNYGVLSAQESGAAGRTFDAVRVSHHFQTQTLGALLTRVDHPFLDRDATVLGIDHIWQPNAKLTVTSNVVGDTIQQRGTTLHGSGGSTIIQYEMNPRWTQQWIAMHFGKTLDINDFGYLPRNNLNYVHWEVRRRFTDLPADSTYASHEWRWRIIGMNNDQGLTLQRQFRVISRNERRDGGTDYLQLNLDASGHDDLLTRGNHALRTHANATLFAERTLPRRGAWGWDLSANVSGNDLTGLKRIGYEIEVLPTYYFSDALSFTPGVSYTYQPNWLIWQRDNLVGSFDGRTLELDAALNWNLSERQELRVRLQALGLNARMRQAYQVGADMRAHPDATPIDDFSLRNLGFQIRYRYQLAPLSNLYIVYGRGGYALEPLLTSTGTQFRQSFNLRDSEQFLVKVAYRFEL
ncbi:DUF5916 domain-containing protein [Oleiagrimonas soli]|nr:DUF5916 domain-containing protein [Oleiagrimonas soli]MBB6183319.1 hypothetical protein [Oleiagrimonas soli]